MKSKARVPSLIDVRITFVVALFVLLPGSVKSQTPAENPNQLVKVEYDATKNFTQVSLNPIVLASRKMEELRLAVISGYPGKTRSTPKEVVLIFLSLSHTDENRYEAARKLSAIADGQRLDWGEVGHTKQQQNGLFVEMMTASVPMDDFLKVSQAKHVKLKLGLTEVDLVASQIAALRLVASYLSQ